MAKNDAPSAVNFQSDAQNVEFQPDPELATEQSGGTFAEAAQNVNWNKVGIGVGAAAAVAGAAYAASKFIGGRESEGGSSSEGSSGKNK